MQTVHNQLQTYNLGQVVLHVQDAPLGSQPPQTPLPAAAGNLSQSAALSTLVTALSMAGCGSQEQPLPNLFSHQQRNSPPSQNAGTGVSPEERRQDARNVIQWTNHSIGPLHLSADDVGQNRQHRRGILQTRQSWLQPPNPQRYSSPQFGGFSAIQK